MASQPTARFADITRSKIFVYVAVFFVSFLLISNIGATKLISFHILGMEIYTDGGAILFPLTYIIGDLLSEVYGFKSASRVIVLGFGVQILASFSFWLVQIAPPASDYQNQVAFEAVLGIVPRFVAASLTGFLFGQLLNSYVLVWLKKRFGENALWVRLIGSTVVGELADTLIFCFIAWTPDIIAGNVEFGSIMNLTIVGWIYKVGVEVILLPVTYVVVAAVKRAEGIAPKKARIIA
ncbi:queuosine precursor transporter [Actinotignum urinale]|uniref:queuosine precursor transporter n=1 Tax=Actinotignum urinale TaxID=190146 RepID=UPI00280B5162|nr:queuosine precursor transporter [Actinotignum urinale]